MMKEIYGNGFQIELKELDPKVRDKAIEIAQTLILEQKHTQADAIKEGIKQAKEWFVDLEG